MILLCGPSGSGKSTYAATLLQRPNTALLSPDELRLELTGDMSNQSKNGFIFNTLLYTRMNGFHNRRVNLVYDATNPAKKDRRPIIEHAKGLGYQIEAHVFRTPIEVCKARNAARTRVVPDEVIDRQFARFAEPTLDEGFSRIVEVAS